LGLYHAFRFRGEDIKNCVPSFSGQFGLKWEQEFFTSTNKLQIKKWKQQINHLVFICSRISVQGVCATVSLDGIKCQCYTLQLEIFLSCTSNQQQVSYHLGSYVQGFPSSVVLVPCVYVQRHHNVSHDMGNSNHHRNHQGLQQVHIQDVYRFQE